MKTEIIDDFLPLNEFEVVKSVLMSNEFPWYYNPYVVETSDANEEFYFTHMLYNGQAPQSQHYGLFNSVFNLLGVKSLIRVKANLYTNVNKQLKNGWHSDYDFTHRGAIFYINSNNGYTELENGEKVLSVANRVLIFDPSVSHRSVFCTDEKCRINVNMNFF